MDSIQAAVSSGTRVEGQDVVQLVVVSGALDGELTGTATAVNDVTVPFADLTAAATAYNTLLAALRARDVITGS